MTTFTHRGRHIRMVPIEREHQEALEAWRRRRAAREQRRREAARRRLWMIVAIVAGMLLGATIARANGPHRAIDSGRQWRTVSVRAGDTLASLAERYLDDAEPIGTRMRRLEEWNGGDLSFLVPGQLIRIARTSESSPLPDR